MRLYVCNKRIKHLETVMFEWNEDNEGFLSLEMVAEEELDKLAVGSSVGNLVHLVKFEEGRTVRVEIFEVESFYRKMTSESKITKRKFFNVVYIVKQYKRIYGARAREIYKELKEANEDA